RSAKPAPSRAAALNAGCLGRAPPCASGRVRANGLGTAELVSGGGRGIRTPERVTPLTVFKCASHRSFLNSCISSSSNYEQHRPQIHFQQYLLNLTSFLTSVCTRVCMATCAFSHVTAYC